MDDGPKEDRNTSFRTRPLWDGTYPFHPFLLAVAAVFALWTRNLDYATLADIAPSLAGSLAFALLAYLVIAGLRRRFDATSAVVASIWIVGCLFYAGLFARLKGAVEGGFALAALALCTFAALKFRGPSRLAHHVLNGIALVLVLTPAGDIVAYEWRNGAARAAYDGERAFEDIQGHFPRQEADERPPDIYHFVFDRYPSENILARHYGMDNTAIGWFLENRGFYVARASNSNYQKTAHSLASTFYLDYLDFLGGDERIQGGNWHPIYEMLDDSRVARFLKSRGYETIQFGSWWVGTYNSPLADENRPHGFSEFAMLYLRRTILKPLFRILPDTPLTMRLDWDNAQCQRVAPQVEEVKAIGERARPVFAFVHILVPHGPYNFAADGRCLDQKKSAERGAKQGFIDQVAYANRIIEDVVTALLSDERRRPIILIQADEGPFPSRNSKIPWQDAPAEELRVKTGILNAYYFPNQDYRLLHDDITPVNSYRILFNTYFGARFPLLRDRVFAFPNDRTLYEFHDVSAKVRGPDTVELTPANSEIFTLPPPSAVP